MLPLIIILDWDGTIAGKVDYQSYKHTLHEYYKKHGLRSSPQSSKAFSPQTNLIRKGFSSFIKDLKTHYNNNIYFFIYTASERKWACKEIQWVEELHDIKFQRPLFTRDDCIPNGDGSYSKSILKIFPRILRSIGKHSLTKAEKEEILHKRLMIIDNNRVYNDMESNLLLCPDYGFAIFEDILEDVPLSYLQTPQIHRFITCLIDEGCICPLFHPEYDINKSIYMKYNWLATKCRSITKENKKYLDDTFFKDLKRLIIHNDLKAFTPKIIRQLQENTWKRVKQNTRD
jgi:hypothetical protein